MASKVTFTILNGLRAGDNFVYEKPDKFLVGRGSECKILFPSDEETVSTEHCQISIQLPIVQIEDLGSTNGTYVNSILLGNKQEKSLLAKEITTNADIKVGNIDIRINFSDRDPLQNVTPQTTQESPTVLNDRSKESAHTGSHRPSCKPIKKSKPESTVQINASKVQAFAGRVIDDATGRLRDLAKNETIEQVVPWIKVFNGNNGELPSYISDHKIVSVLGKGKYGEVCIAIDSSGRKIALKRILDEVSSSKNVKERFKQEMENLKLLRHKNIVRMMGSGSYKNNDFYTMEYCKIGSLEDLIKFMGGTLPMDIAMKIIIQVLDGLTYLHEEANLMIGTSEGYVNANILVHRDLKPSNILLTNDGLNLVAKIGDFGVSKAFGVEAMNVLTQQGSKPLGTYQFMCRRQQLVFSEADPAGDIWAAAACLYYMLTGEYPRDFSKSILPDVVVTKEDAIPILERNDRISPELAAVIDDALWEDRDNDNCTKFQSAADFKQALMQVFP
jgi:eukaryotic-like serine/threonine-protein kinase